MVKKIQEVDVRGKKVLVRCDYNISNKGTSEDGFRVEATIPTVKFLIENGARVILMSHLGEPNGTVNEEYRLTIIAKKLSEYLNIPVKKANDCIGPDVESMVSALKDGEVLLLENLRFHIEEQENDDEFAKKLAGLADIFVQEAFGACHRAHASMVGVPKYLPSYAGMLLQKEISTLSNILKNPKRPFVVVMGGVKISTKLKLIEKFLQNADTVLLGGALANNVLAAKGNMVGKSLVEKDILLQVQSWNADSDELLIPKDVIVTTDLKDGSQAKVKDIKDMAASEYIVDIGPETINAFKGKLNAAQTILWNGPLGLVEVPQFSNGTKEVSQFISDLNSFRIIGGGDTISSLGMFNISLNKFDFVSTGGGAMLDFMAGKKLPGIEALNV